MITFKDLQEEYRRSVIGTHIYSLIFDVCTKHLESNRSILRFWQEDSLAAQSDATWDTELADSIITQFIAEKLLNKANKTLKYLFAEAASIESLKKLIRLNFSWYAKDHLRQSGKGNVISRLDSLVRNANLGLNIIVMRRTSVLPENVLAARMLTGNTPVFAGRADELSAYSDPSKYALKTGKSGAKKRAILVATKDMIAWMEDFLIKIACPVYYRDIKWLFINDFGLEIKQTSIYEKENQTVPEKQPRSNVLENKEVWNTLSHREKAVLATFEDLNAAIKLLDIKKSAIYNERKKVLAALKEQLDGTNEEIAAQIISFIERSYEIYKEEIKAFDTSKGDQ